MPAPRPGPSIDPDEPLPQPGESARIFEMLCRPIVFEVPDRVVPPPSWLDHIPFAFWLIDVVRPATFVELGTHSGNSYAAFAQAIQKLALGTAAYAVDTWAGDAQSGYYDESVFHEWEAYHASHFASFSRLVRSTFEEALAHFPDGVIDLLHIDGYHTYEAVSVDFEQWLPKLSARGVVLFHDTNVRERDFGAWRFWQEVKSSYPWFEFLHGHGLGVLGVGEHQPRTLRRLFSAAQNGAEAQAVRTFFATLGSGVGARLHGPLEVSRLQVEVKAAIERARVAEAASAERASELEKRAGEVLRLREHLAAAHQSAERANRESEASQRQLADLEVRLEAAGNERTRLEAEVEAKEQARTRLVLEVEELRRSARIHARAAPGTHERQSFADGAIAPLRRTTGRLLRGLRTLGRAARTPAVLGLVPSRRRPLRPASLKLLLSPSSLLDAHIIVASGLFDESYYLAASPDVAASGASPLAHFVRRGAVEGRSPHPLFDAGYYTRQNSDVALARTNPLVHYLRFGAAEHRNPHPLFDVGYYLQNNPDVLATGIEPLAHFLRFGAMEGRDPNPLFDCVYYLSTNPDVAASGMNPLIHFVTEGWRERRRPSARFDLSAYLEHNEDVARSNRNPLEHYLEYGLKEGRPTGVTAQGDPVELSADAEAPAIVMKVRSLGTARSLDAQPPTIVCLSHVMPVNPRAGNEYRIFRLLRWLHDRGYRIVPVIAPLPGEEVTTESVRQLAAEFSNAVVCWRDGTVQYDLSSVPDTLGSLNGDIARPVSLLLDEAGIRGSHQVDLLRMDRTFCHDALITVVTRLQEILGPHILLAEYIWMTRAFPLLGPGVIKVVDTIDVFSTKRDKVLRFGIDDLHVEPLEEARRLRLADLVVAIQEDERRELERLVRGKPIVTAGVDFDVTGNTRAPSGRRVLYVASGNPMNKKGLEDFLRFAWPRIRQEVDGAELCVAGDVGTGLVSEVPGVVRLGRVPDLAPLYEEARVVINPAAAGTGVKIKTLEALGYFRPVVTWPSGVDGIAPELADLCHVVRDWYTFGRTLSGLLAMDPPASFSPEQQERIRKYTAPEATYGALTDVLEQLMLQRWGRSFDSRTASPVLPGA